MTNRNPKQACGGKDSDVLGVVLSTNYGCVMASYQYAEHLG
ncbi:hypothetical protein [Alkalimonas mucilaginosa]|uniref:Uncharacterized protein n=1 Tax=Alkalimonas mucilaginosa TaxID=3057676 RepID=A0ABU7JKA4_9GAMM|nr:hypothetical protein [Alkalimonas sp. MEB004]MEE2026101.1 hypothetical protein [Alkalimonas sp. MEB004]